MPGALDPPLTDGAPAGGSGAPGWEPGQVSLRDRFLDPKTLLSFAFVIALLAFFWYRSGVDPGQVIKTLRGADPALLAAAFAAYYVTFVIRAERWCILMANAGMRLPLRTSLRYIVLSWFANCIVPAKMGDVYRAYLVRRSHRHSGFRVLGTVVVERIVDLVVLMVLLLFAGTVVLQRHLPKGSSAGTNVLLALAAGAVLVAGLVAGILVLRVSEGRISRMLPARLARVTTSIKEGVLGSLGKLPVVGGLTVLVWLLESGRLYLVLAAVGLPQSALLVVFLALSAALLTTIPITPGGSGAVELAMYQILLTFGDGISSTAAISIAILDRAISYYSVIVVGGITFFLSGRR
ncbi:MAG: lysylphosphatidylglycerol synthase transmembrane domain-containing protein [Candidatus Dormibacteria bacterium]